MAELTAELRAQVATELVGVAEIADRTSKSTAAAWALTKLEGFPAPIRLAMGPVWFWSDVEAFLAVPRRPGPKPRQRASDEVISKGHPLWHKGSHAPGRHDDMPPHRHHVGSRGGWIDLVPEPSDDSDG